MKYDIMFSKNCYFCGDNYTRGVLYREPKKKPFKIRICKKHYEEMIPFTQYDFREVMRE